MADFSNLSGISSAAYTDYAAKTQYSNEVQKAVSNAPKSETEQELMEACKQFEAYFLEQVFKEMSKTVDAFKTDDSQMSDALSMTNSNSLVDYFKDLTIQDIAATSADTQSNGLAQMLYENMKRTYGIGDEASRDIPADASQAQVLSTVSSLQDAEMEKDTEPSESENKESEIPKTGEV